MGSRRSGLIDECSLRDIVEVRSTQSHPTKTMDEYNRA